MNKRSSGFLFALLLVLVLVPGIGAAPIELVRALAFGTAGDDNCEGAAEGPDGCLYLVGNTGQAIEPRAELPVTTTLGAALPDPRVGCGYVLKLSPDGSNVLGVAQFAAGILHATAVAVTDSGVYVGGYASHGLEPLLNEHSGLIRDYPLRAALARAEAATDAERAADPLNGRPWLQRLGAPCVVKLSPDLKTLQSGTYLEGWEQVYDKQRVCGHLTEKRRKGFPGMFREFFWQPINICPLESGDVIVVHDGGYFRETTDTEVKSVGHLESEDERRKLLERLGFYDVGDYVSRLSGDLTARRWRRDIKTPPIDPEVGSRIKKGWQLDHFGNVRVHRMRGNERYGVWVCGWSATLTSSEPWWSPFLWKLNPDTGEPEHRFYEYDPMGGGGNRMGGMVADTALLSVAIEEDGDLLTCLISDGGNSWMTKGPRGNEGASMATSPTGPGLMFSPAHFWGQTHRVDARTYDGLGGVQSGPWAWQIDAAGLPDKHFLALGRWNHPLPWTHDAWWTDADATQPNPNAFLRVVGPDYRTIFWTAIPGVRPFELVAISGDRAVMVGSAEAGVAPVKPGPIAQPPGGTDAWFAIVRWSEAGQGERESVDEPDAEQK